MGVDPIKRNLLKAADKNSAELFLVGGSLRDLILKKKISDYDMAVSGNSRLVSCDFSGIIKGSWITMDSEREIFRVVKKNLIFDFTKLEKDVFYDLTKRDFTINSLALDIKRQKFHDPLGGYEDLKRALIRANHSRIFSEDPLRLMRAYRLAAQLNFKIEPETRNLIKRNAYLIKKVKAERIRLELLYLLKADFSYPHIKELAEFGIFKNIFNGKKTDFVSLRKLKKFEKKVLFFQKDSILKNWLKNKISFTSTSKEIIKLFILLNSLGYDRKEKLEFAAEKLKLSIKEKKVLLTFGGYGGIDEKNNPGVFLLDKIYHPRFNLTSALERYKKYLKLEERFNELVSGRDILKALKIKPGPAVGKILRQIKKEFYAGKLKTRPEILRRITGFFERTM